MTDYPFEFDPWQQICPRCAAVVAALEFHLTNAHPATPDDVAPTEEAPIA